LNFSIKLAFQKLPVNHFVILMQPVVFRSSRAEGNASAIEEIESRAVNKRSAGAGRGGGGRSRSLSSKSQII
jgi:hypothetical protein